MASGEFESKLKRYQLENGLSPLFVFQTYPASLKLHVAPGYIYIDELIIKFEGGLTDDFVPPSVDKRVDLLVLDIGTQEVQIVEGISDPDPVAPPRPDETIPLAEVLISATDTGIIQVNITDIRPIFNFGSGITGDQTFTSAEFLVKSPSAVLQHEVVVTALEDDLVFKGDQVAPRTITFGQTEVNPDTLVFDASNIRLDSFGTFSVLDRSINAKRLTPGIGVGASLTGDGELNVTNGLTARFVRSSITEQQVLSFTKSEDSVSEEGFLIQPSFPLGTCGVTLGLDEAIEYLSGSAIDYNIAHHFDPNQGTIRLWITPSWDGSDPIEAPILFRDETSDTSDGHIFLLQKETDGTLRFSISRSGFSAEVSVDISDWLADVTHHVVAVWDFNNKVGPDVSEKLALYVDSAPAYGEATTGTWTKGESQSSSHLKIGVNASGHTLQSTIVGFLIESRPWTESQVVQDYNFANQSLYMYYLYDHLYPGISYLVPNASGASGASGGSELYLSPGGANCSLNLTIGPDTVLHVPVVGSDYTLNLVSWPQTESSDEELLLDHNMNGSTLTSEWNIPAHPGSSKTTERYYKGHRTLKLVANSSYFPPDSLETDVSQTLDFTEGETYHLRVVYEASGSGSKAGVVVKTTSGHVLASTETITTNGIRHLSGVSGSGIIELDYTIPAGLETDSVTNYVTSFTGGVWTLPYLSCVFNQDVYVMSVGGEGYKLHRVNGPGSAELLTTDTYLGILAPCSFGGINYLYTVDKSTGDIVRSTDGTSYSTVAGSSHIYRDFDDSTDHPVSVDVGSISKYGVLYLGGGFGPGGIEPLPAIFKSDSNGENFTGLTLPISDLGAADLSTGSFVALDNCIIVGFGLTSTIGIDPDVDIGSCFGRINPDDTVDIIASWTETPFYALVGGQSQCCAFNGEAYFVKNKNDLSDGRVYRVNETGIVDYYEFPGDTLLGLNEINGVMYLGTQSGAIYKSTSSNMWTLFHQFEPLSPSFPALISRASCITPEPETWALLTIGLSFNTTVQPAVVKFTVADRVEVSLISKASSTDSSSTVYFKEASILHNLVEEGGINDRALPVTATTDFEWDFNSGEFNLHTYGRGNQAEDVDLVTNSAGDGYSVLKPLASRSGTKKHTFSHIQLSDSAGNLVLNRSTGIKFFDSDSNASISHGLQSGLDFGASDDFTIQFWYCLADGDLSGGPFNILSKSDSTTGYAFQLNTTGTVTFTVKDGTDVVSATSSSIVGTAFTHFAVVVDRTLQTATLYVNGVSQVVRSLSSIGSLSNTEDFVIGGDGLVGYLGQVSVSSDALSESDIENNVTYGLFTDAGTVSIWEFNGNTIDVVGSNALTPSGLSYLDGPYFSYPCSNFNKCVYITDADQTGLDLDSSTFDNVIIYAIIQMPYSAQLGNDQAILTKDDGTTGVSIRVKDDGTVYASFRDGSDQVEVTSVATVFQSYSEFLNSFHVVKLVITGTAGASSDTFLTLYVDEAAPVVSNTFSGSIDASNAADFVIGSFSHRAGNFFTGIIGDVFIGTSDVTYLSTVEEVARNGCVTYIGQTATTPFEHWKWTSKNGAVQAPSSNLLSLQNMNLATVDIITTDALVALSNDPYLSVPFDILPVPVGLRYGSNSHTGNYLTVPGTSTYSFGTGNFSIGAWVKVDLEGVKFPILSTGVDDGLGTISGVTIGTCALGYLPGTGINDNGISDIRWRLTLNDGSNFMSVVSDTTITSREWVYVEFVVNRATNVATIYENTVVVATDDISFITGSIDSTITWDIGRLQGTGNKATLASGSIDQVRVETRALTYEEVVANYQFVRGWEKYDPDDGTFVNAEVTSSNEKDDSYCQTFRAGENAGIKASSPITLEEDTWYTLSVQVRVVNGTDTNSIAIVDAQEHDDFLPRIFSSLTSNFTIARFSFNSKGMTEFTPAFVSLGGEQVISVNNVSLIKLTTLATTSKTCRAFEWLDQNCNFNLRTISGNLLLRDQYLSSPIPLSETGVSGLSPSFSATSIIGALNELKTGGGGGGSASSLDDAYDGPTGLGSGRTVTVDSGAVQFLNSDGTQDALELQGNLIFTNDGESNIGADGANRPDYIYAKTQVKVGDSINITTNTINSASTIEVSVGDLAINTGGGGGGGGGGPQVVAASSDPVAITGVSGALSEDYNLVLLDVGIRIAIFCPTAWFNTAASAAAMFGQPVESITFMSSDNTFTNSPGPVFIATGAGTNYTWDNSSLDQSTVGAITSPLGNPLLNWNGSAYEATYAEWVLGAVTYEWTPSDGPPTQDSYFFLSAGSTGGGGSFSGDSVGVDGSGSGVFFDPSEETLVVVASSATVIGGGKSSGGLSSHLTLDSTAGATLVSDSGIDLTVTSSGNPVSGLACDDTGSTLSGLAVAVGSGDTTHVAIGGSEVISIGSGGTLVTGDISQIDITTTTGISFDNNSGSVTSSMQGGRFIRTSNELTEYSNTATLQVPSSLSIDGSPSHEVIKGTTLGVNLSGTLDYDLILIGIDFPGFSLFLTGIVPAGLSASDWENRTGLPPGGVVWASGDGLFTSSPGPILTNNGPTGSWTYDSTPITNSTVGSVTFHASSDSNPPAITYIGGDTSHEVEFTACSFDSSTFNQVGSGRTGMMFIASLETCAITASASSGISISASQGVTVPHLTYLVTEFTSAGDVTMDSLDPIPQVLVINKSVGEATTITLPSSPLLGESFLIKDGKGDASTNNITVTPSTGTIDGFASITLNISRGAASLVYLGSNKWMIS